MALNSIEEPLGRTVEGVFKRKSRLRVRPIELGRRLLSEMDHNREVDLKGRRLVPNVFTIKLHPSDRAGFTDVEPALIAELAEAVKHYAKDEGYHLPAEVKITFVEDESQKPGRFTVDTQIDKSAPGDSAWTEERDPVVTSSAVTPSVSYLVRGSGEKIRLSEKAVVIGRQTECDLVIPDSNVSRKHAEVRIMPEGATITDLGSTNGTKVNGVKITASRVLANGDAIEIGPEQVRVEIA